MNTKELGQNFFRDGFLVLENCIGDKVIEKLRHCTNDTLSRIAGKKVTLKDGLAAALEKHRLSDIQLAIHSDMQNVGLRKQALLEPKVLEVFTELIGPDLAYGRNGQISINISGQKDGLYLKKWHQEMWSGAGLNEVWIWFPVFIDSEGDAGVEFLRGSHLWGLIPNRNREPTEIPQDAEQIQAKITEGSAVFFHTLTLHRTVVNNYDMPRVAFSTGVRNFTHAFSNNEEFMPWTPFHISPVQRIRKALGNSHLTPFRTYGGKLSNHDDGKESLEGLDEYFL